MPPPPQGCTLALRPYLAVPPFPGRQLLTKLRLNDMPWRGLPVNSQGLCVCPVCSDPLSDHRAHFLLGCKPLSEVRLAFQDRLPVLYQRRFSKAARVARLLLSDRLASDQAHILAVGAFVSALWARRQELFHRPSSLHLFSPGY